jgi:hypothetical protein
MSARENRCASTQQACVVCRSGICINDDVRRFSPHADCDLYSLVSSPAAHTPWFQMQVFRPKQAFDAFPPQGISVETCHCEGCHSEYTKLDGVATLELCRSKCAADSRCKMMMHAATQQSCSLYDHGAMAMFEAGGKHPFGCWCKEPFLGCPAPSAPFPNDGVTVELCHCDGCTAHYHEPTLPPAADQFACQSACASDNQCKMAVFNASSASCKLYDHGAKMMTESQEERPEPIFCWCSEPHLGCPAPRIRSLVENPKVFTVAELLRHLNVSTVDMLLIDEPRRAVALLQSIDWSAIRVPTIVLGTAVAAAHAEPLRRILAGLGYTATSDELSSAPLVFTKPATSHTAHSAGGSARNVLPSYALAAQGLLEPVVISSPRPFETVTAGTIQLHTLVRPAVESCDVFVDGSRAHSFDGAPPAVLALRLNLSLADQAAVPIVVRERGPLGPIPKPNRFPPATG